MPMNLFAGVTPALNARSRSIMGAGIGRASVEGQVRGTFTATLTPQVRAARPGQAAGDDWQSVNVEDLLSATDAELATLAVNNVFRADLGALEFSVLISAYTSGTPEVWVDVIERG